MDTLDCTFSLLDEGRKYSGQHRKYVIENARDICYSPATREKIKLREAFGFYGHGRRVLAGKMDLQEVDVITMPDGTQAMVSNIPSNICTKFEVAEDGTVSHSQEILDTETGHIVASLNASRVGGFSWACPGTDGGRTHPTKLTGFSGFDYVLQPGFSTNRAYVLESAAGSGNTEQLIMESVAAVVKDDKRAAQLVAGWRLEGARRIAELEDAIFESDARYYEMMDKNTALQAEIDAIKSKNADADKAVAAEKERFKGILEGIADAMPFFIPQKAMDDLLEGDFRRARQIFESASVFDFTQFPLARETRTQGAAIDIDVPHREEAEYGSAAYGFGLKL